MSISQILAGGGAAPAYLNAPLWSGRATLVAGGVGAQYVATPPFAVSQQTCVLITPLGSAPLGAWYATRAFGAPGAGTVTVNSANAGDAGKEVMISVWNTPDLV